MKQQDTSFNSYDPITDNPDYDKMQFKLSGRQMRVVEIAMDHLDDLPNESDLDGRSLRAPVAYAANVLLYDVRPQADVELLVGAIGTHLRQAGVLTAAERLELIPDAA